MPQTATILNTFQLGKRQDDVAYGDCTDVEHYLTGDTSEVNSMWLPLNSHAIAAGTLSVKPVESSQQRGSLLERMSMY